MYEKLINRNLNVAFRRHNILNNIMHIEIRKKKKKKQNKFNIQFREHKNDFINNEGS